MRRLLRLRLTLAEFCLAMLEEHCAEKKRQALARQRKTAAEIAMEEFTCCTPEPNSIEEARLGQICSCICLDIIRLETLQTALSKDVMSLLH